MTPQEIADIFAELELQLIRSIKSRLLSRQPPGSRRSSKRQELQRFRRRNRQLMEQASPAITREIAALLEDAFDDGVRETAAQHTAAHPEYTLEGAFDSLDTRRLETLIEDVQEDFRTAETAALRRTDDIYKKIVYRAEAAQASGLLTMEQAVDQAAREFLEQGIACIQYADGRRVNIAAYAEMALRTASLRSRLRGDAALRKELGVDTVVVSQYGACSDTCLPWQGRVYIDDVWGEPPRDIAAGRGLSRNGRWYPLLSVAVEAGLFHPNCRHGLSTWYEGISKPPSVLDATPIRRTATLENRQRELERKVRKYKRLEAGALDPANEKKYRQKRMAAQKQLREHIAANSDVLRRDYWREKTYGMQQQPKRQLTSQVKHATLSEEDVYALDQYKKSGVAYPLNYSLRNGLELSEQESDLVRRIDAALDKLPEYTGMVYRSVSAASLDDVEAFEQTHKTLGYIRYYAYTSTSADAPYDPTMEYQFVIRSRHGRDMRRYNPLEQEVLFKRGTVFIITKRIGNTFYMEEI